MGPLPASSAIRYELFDELARGGMARVHLGRALGAVGFARTVAIKRLHRSHGDDPELVAMLLDEARLLTRVRHPNVVPILDVIEQDGELLLAMEYVHGETLARLSRACPGGRLPPAVAATAVAGALHGLHAAHEARDEQGVALELVHRDVSPQNIMVGTDGLARVLDFGIAKAAQRSQITKQGHIKGKYSYMAPEQIRRGPVDRRTDVFAAAAVLWELLTGHALFNADNPAAVMMAVINKSIEAPGLVVEGVPPALDAVVLKGLERDPEQRYATAREMALAIERAIPSASAVEIGAWVETAAAEALANRSRLIAGAELATQQTPPAHPSHPSYPGHPGRPSYPSHPGHSSPAARPNPHDIAGLAGADASPASRSDAWVNTPRPNSQADPPTSLALTQSTPPSLRLDVAATEPPAVPPSSNARWGLALLLPIAAGFALTLVLVARGSSLSGLGPESRVPRQPNTLETDHAPASAPNGAAPAAPVQAGAPAALAPAVASTALSPGGEPTTDHHGGALGSPETTPLAGQEASAARPAASLLTPPEASRAGRPGAARPGPRPSTPRRTPSAVEPTPDSCSPPYSIENGIRVLKPHCI
ncbi:MAG: protein kinase [Polyangiaceae bacterium]|nr:protein kinase [Polyangiaceae bacterium]